MKYKKCTDPRVFGLGVFVPKKYYSYIKKYVKEINPYVDWAVKKDYKYPGTNATRMHITVKYLGYHKKYSNSQIKKLIPEIKEIAKEYLPLKIKVKGIRIETKYKQAGVLLNYKTDKKAKKFHNEIIKKLGSKIDIFENMDGRNFGQHIVIGAGQKTSKNIRELRKIAKKSKKDKEITIKLSEPYIFFKGKGPISLILSKKQKIRWLLSNHQKR